MLPRGGGLYSYTSGAVYHITSPGVGAGLGSILLLLMDQMLQAFREGKVRAHQVRAPAVSSLYAEGYCMGALAMGPWGPFGLCQYASS